MLDLWGMLSTTSLPSLPGPLWPGMVAPDKAPIYVLNRTNSVLLIVVGNGHGDTSSNPGRD